jgi:phage-related protein
MSEQIGLRAILETKEFQKGLNTYLSGVEKLNTETNKTAKGMNSGLQSANKGFLGANKGALAFGATVAGLAGGVLVVKELGEAIIGVGAATLNSAADMEQQLANITSLMGGTAEETQMLKGLITDLGLDPGLKVSATEAADSIELLVRNGVELQDIMDGAARSSIALANATGADFGAAADIGTDAMSLFNIQAKDMNEAVNGITSVVTSSKFDINDYRLALAQAGGVASSVGVEFDDFNTSISAIAPLFASGSDAGTSFKTFLQRLVPTTKPAAEAMRELGLFTGLTDDEFGKVTKKMDKVREKIAKLDPETKNYNKKVAELKHEYSVLESQLVAGNNAFFDSQGNMKSMSEISELLSNATAGLSEEEKNLAFSTIFGTDAMRAAFGLAKAGESDMIQLADGTMVATTAFEQLQGKMGETKASELIEKRMDTLQGTMEVIGGVFETVGIKIGEAILPTARKIANRFLELTERVMPLVEPALVLVEQGVSSLANTLDTFLGPAIDGAINMLSNFLGVNTDIDIDANLSGIPGLDKIKDIVLPDIEGGEPSFFQSIKSFFADLPSIASDAMATVSGVFSSFVGFVTGTVVPGFTRLADVIFGGGEGAITLSGIWEGLLQPAIQSVGWWIENVLTPAFNIMIDILSTLLPPVITVVSFLFTDLLIPAISMLGSAYASVIEFVETNMPLFRQIMETVFGAVTTAINFVSESVIPFLLDGFEQLKTFIPPIIERISIVWENILLPAIKQVISTASFLFDVWKKNMPIVFDLAKEVFNRIGVWIGFIIDKVMPVFLAQLDKLFVFWDENGPLIVSTMKTVSDFIVNILVDAFEDAIGIIKQVGEAAIFAFDIMMEAVKVAWAFIAPIFNSMFDILLEMGQLIMQVITGDWAGAWDSALTIVDIAIEGIIHAIMNTVNAILELFDTNMRDAVQSWQNNWSMIKQIVSLAWENVLSSISTAIDDIKGFFGNIFGTIINTWSDNWEMVKQIASLAWENIVTSVESALLDLGESVKSAWETIFQFTSEAIKGWIDVMAEG